jgi:hypothetical protein
VLAASFSTICCRSGGSDRGVVRQGDVFGRVIEMQAAEQFDAGDRGVQRALLERRHHVAG